MRHVWARIEPLLERFEANSGDVCVRVVPPLNRRIRCELERNRRSLRARMNRIYCDMRLRKTSPKLKKYLARHRGQDLLSPPLCSQTAALHSIAAGCNGLPVRARCMA